jgi:hypothetical protein
MIKHNKNIDKTNSIIVITIHKMKLFNNNALIKTPREKPLKNEIIGKINKIIFDFLDI